MSMNHPMVDKLQTFKLLPFSFYIPFLFNVSNNLAVKAAHMLSTLPWLRQVAECLELSCLLKPVGPLHQKTLKTLLFPLSSLWEK